MEEEYIQLKVADIETCLSDILNVNPTLKGVVMRELKAKAVTEELEDGNKPRTTCIWVVCDQMAPITPEKVKTGHSFMWYHSRLANNPPQDLEDRHAITHLILCSNDLSSLRKMRTAISHWKVRFVEFVMFAASMNRGILGDSFPGHSTKLYTEKLSQAIESIKGFCRKAFPSLREAKGINWSEEDSKAAELGRNKMNAGNSSGQPPSGNKDGKDDTKSKHHPAGNNGRTDRLQSRSSCNPDSRSSANFNRRNDDGSSGAVNSSNNSRRAPSQPPLKKKRPSPEEMKEYYKRFPLTNYDADINKERGDGNKTFRIPRKHQRELEDGEIISQLDTESTRGDVDGSMGGNFSDNNGEDYNYDETQSPYEDDVPPPPGGQPESEDDEVLPPGIQRDHEDKDNNKDPGPIRISIPPGTPSDQVKQTSRKKKNPIIPAVYNETGAVDSQSTNIVADNDSTELCITPLKHQISACDVTRDTRLETDRRRRHYFTLNGNEVYPYRQGKSKTTKYYQRKIEDAPHNCGLPTAACIPMHPGRWECIGPHHPPTPETNARKARSTVEV